MDSLICDLVRYDRAARDRFHVAPIVLMDPLREALLSLQSEMEKKKARLEVKEPLPTVLAHPLLMEHVFSHLISNALKFVPGDVTPQVRIFSEDAGSRCRICIQDNGIGIPF